VMDLSNPDAALRFAYGNTPVLKISRYFADLRQSPTTKRQVEKSSPWDEVAQRGMLQAFVARLDAPLEAFVWAKYRRGQWRDAGYQALAEHCAKAGHELNDVRLVKELVAWRFGRPTRKLHARFGVDRKTVYRQKLKVKAILDAIDVAVDDAVRECFREQ
jgi:hypothetical protein